MTFLKIGAADLSAEISPYGAALARVWFHDHPTSLVLGLANPADYADAPHAMGVIVGPIAGRVSNARTTINGRSYQMEANAPPHCLHSGSDGLQHRFWETEEHSTCALTLRCHLPDGACGLPGNRTVRAIYEIKNTTLQLTIEATSDADTVFNATSHAYWALDDRGDLKAHRLKIPSTRYLEFDAETVPTGSILNAQGGNLDFSSARSPVDGPALDACFCLSDTTVDTIRPVLTLHSKQTNLRLNISSNQPGVVVYSAAGMPSFSNVAQTPEIGPFSGIAIEAQGWPDANNHTSFPSIDLKSKTVLKQITHFSLEMP